MAGRSHHTETIRARIDRPRVRTPRAELRPTRAPPRASPVTRATAPRTALTTEMPRTPAAIAVIAGTGGTVGPIDTEAARVPTARGRERPRVRGIPGTASRVTRPRMVIPGR